MALEKLLLLAQVTWIDEIVHTQEQFDVLF